ncbi:MAG: lipoprotein-releasing system ATP-binding protein LolD [Planctomycetota bacterium]|nr:MAG: lipoprotein-releasing system ATP-binding protein LolD [Planctomycetota bacterium]
MSEPASSAAREASLAVRAEALVKLYEGGRVRALDGLSLEVRAGAFVAICGPSGCGKSTLLNILAAIDRPDAGQIAVAGQDLLKLSNGDLDVFRACQVGLIFQLHNLLPNLTALQNVQVPMMTLPPDGGSRAARAAHLLARVGLGDRLHALPTALSGGERQRVAIARSLANRPRLLLADEPTGALDSRNGDMLIALLEDVRREYGMTLVLVTHDARLAERAERIVHMKDGRTVDAG